MATPYITPGLLIQEPSGISWNILPWPKSTQPEQLAAQTLVCWQATGIVESYVNQVLRATVDTDEATGPDFRITVDPWTQVARYTLQRWPVTSILAGQVSPAATFPPNWTQIPAQKMGIETPVLGVYGSSSPSGAGDGSQAIRISPGCVGRKPRNGYLVSATYLNGWPHTSLTADASEGDTTIQVDDVTGFGITNAQGFTGASAFAYDGAETETVTVESVTPNAMLTLPNGGGTVAAGPGTLQLAAPLANAHLAGVMVSSFPQNLLWAAALAATVQALQSGIQAITIQNIPGSVTTGGQGVGALKAQYKELLTPFKRVI